MPDFYRCPSCDTLVWVTSDAAHRCTCGASIDPRVYAPSGLLWRDLAEQWRQEMMAWMVADGMSASSPGSDATIRTMRERGHHRQADLAAERRAQIWRA